MSAMDRALNITPKTLLLASCVTAVVVAGYAYSVHARAQQEHAYNASVAATLPPMAFEYGAPLSEAQKAQALSIYDIESRITVAAGLAEDYSRPEFFSEYLKLRSEGQSEAKNEFDKRQQAREGRAEAEAAFNRYRASFQALVTRSEPVLMTGNSILSLGGYDFKQQGFRVKGVGDSGGRFSARTFRDIEEARRVAGAGASSFSRVLNSSKAYEVTDRLWPVPENVAKDINTERFKVYATVYYALANSSSSGQRLLLHCTQIDLYSDLEKTKPIGSQGCRSLNVSIRF